MAKKKTEIKIKEPVRIREKDLKDGGKSLYLDIYLNGNRKKEGLKLYLVPEVSAAAKLQNKNTWKLAEQIKAQRILDIQKVGLVDWEKVKQINTTVLEVLDKYIESGAELSESSTRSKRKLKARVQEYLIYINKENLPMNKVDKDFCKGFIAFLKTCTYNQGKKTLSSTTQRMFINRFGTVIDNAIRDGIMTMNPMRLLDKKEKPKKDNAEKEFLTIDEIKKAIATDCRYSIVKMAFLFSCFTGLRWSDIITLEWKHIHDAADGKTQYIEKKQVKTGRWVVIPLCKDAYKWMPEKVEGEDLVFHEIGITQTTVEVVLQEWMDACGIKKHITYHCSRHTAATMWLTLGANLFVVSKILGHQSIKVTEVYARIVDQTKIETMNLVNNLFDGYVTKSGLTATSQGELDAVNAFSELSEAGEVPEVNDVQTEQKGKKEPAANESKKPKSGKAAKTDNTSKTAKESKSTKKSKA